MVKGKSILSVLERACWEGKAKRPPEPGTYLSKAAKGREDAPLRAPRRDVTCRQGRGPSTNT